MQASSRCRVNVLATAGALSVFLPVLRRMLATMCAHITITKIIAHIVFYVVQLLAQPKCLSYLINRGHTRRHHHINEPLVEHTPLNQILMNSVMLVTVHLRRVHPVSALALACITARACLMSHQ